MQGKIYFAKNTDPSGSRYVLEPDSEEPIKKLT